MPRDVGRGSIRRKRWHGEATDELPFVDPGAIGGQGLLLDTCVYIDQMQGRSPHVLDDLVTQRQVNHSTVAIQELMHTVGVLNPSDLRTAGCRRRDRQADQGDAAAPDLSRPSCGYPRKGGAAVRNPGRLQGYEKDGKLRALGIACCSCRRRSSAWWC